MDAGSFATGGLNETGEKVSTIDGDSRELVGPGSEEGRKFWKIFVA